MSRVIESSTKELLEALDKIEKSIFKRTMDREQFAAQVLSRRGDLSILLASGYMKPGSIVAWIDRKEILPFGYVIDARKRLGKYILAVKEWERVYDSGKIVEADNVYSLILRREALEKIDEILKFKFYGGRRLKTSPPAYLDQWQEECYVASLSLEDGEILLVVGPPGCGKTTLISEASFKLSETERVWVTSNTNIAVDNVLEKMSKALRIGHPSKISPTTRKHSVEYFYLSKIEFQDFEDYARSIIKAYKEISRVQDKTLRRGRIVVGSTILKGMMSLIKNYDFDTVFIDEASNTCISTALLALDKAKKAIIVGDPYQLPPVYEFFIKNSIKFSAFNYLWSIYRKSLWLRRHYRCNYLIAKFAAENVYGFLDIHPKCRDVKITPCKTSIEEVGDSEKPVVFLDCDGVEKKVGKSKLNEVEAEIVCELCDELTCCMSEDKIGVITPYVKQREFILSLLSSFGLDIEVSTVHSYQGREKDVIIYSITATQNPYFASEKRIFNVALTRARKKFIAVGNSRPIFKKNFLLSKFLEYAKMNGGFVRVSKRI